MDALEAYSILKKIMQQIKSLGPILAVLVVAVGGYYMFFMNSTVTNGGINEVMVGGATVSYSDEGYAPASITIKASESVLFVSSAETQMQPSFGEHTDHDSYPDKKEHHAVEKGGSDSIMFPEAGTFQYHNHFEEEHIGTVVVQ